MKRYDDYEDHEILQMTDEDIDKLIEIECAVAGAPLKSEQPKMPETCTAEPDVLTYTVNAGTLRFADEQVALRVAAFLSDLPLLDRKSLSGRWDGPHCLVPENDIPRVQVERNWSAEHFAAHGKAVEAASRAKEE